MTIKNLASWVKNIAISALLVCGVTNRTQAQKATTPNSHHISKTITVCPFNVDGLPPTILGIPINSDGLGEEGAKAIGDYIAQSGVNFYAFSEDFNYHNSLVANLTDLYQIGAYRGGITAGNMSGTTFNTDGLEFLSKYPFTFSQESWTKWNKSYGKTSNGSDELIMKGFRHYVVDLGDNAFIDFYIMHMDADTAPEDNAARASQWEQLRDAILANKSGHPIIVMGDTNSRYTRDDILNLFINPIEQTGSYEVKDAWVELCKSSTYPTLGSDALMVNELGYKEGEIVDKVIYLNPKGDGLHIEATAFDVDENMDKSDHKPVIVTLNIEGATFAANDASQWWRGEDITSFTSQPAYIYNVGSGIFISGTSPSVKNIDEAYTWNITGSSPYTFACNNSTADRIYMTNSLGWKAGIKEKSGASDFTVEEGTTQDKGHAYKLSVSSRGTRYFNVDGDHYSAATTKSNMNDWLFISQEQKEAYQSYKQLYDKANSYRQYEISSNLTDQLDKTLEETMQGSYDTYANDQQALKTIIQQVDDYLKQHPTDIGNIDRPSQQVKPIAIYDLKGVRRSHMTRGINIVRMSNGEVKKISY